MYYVMESFTRISVKVAIFVMQVHLMPSGELVPVSFLLQRTIQQKYTYTAIHKAQEKTVY